MKNRMVLIAALTLVFCLIFSGCTNSADTQDVSTVIQVGDAENGSTQSSDVPSGDAQDGDALTGWRLPPENITENPTTVTEATPDTLEGTAWMLNDPENPENSMALFFKDGIMTFVRADTCFGSIYEYEGTQLEAYHDEDAYYGEAIEGLLYVLTTDRDGESIARWSNVEDVLQLAKALNSSFTAPFSPEELGIYFDAPFTEEELEEINEESEGTVIIDDGNLIVTYIRKEYQKNVYVDVPSLLMHIESNYSDTIQIQVAGSVNGRTDQGRFILKDLDGQWTMMGVVVPPATQFNTHIAFLTGSIYTEQMPLEDYVNIDLRIVVYDEEAFNLIKEYDVHIDGNAASVGEQGGESTEVTSGYVPFDCDLFTSEIPADWRVTTAEIQYVVSTIEQPHDSGEPYCYIEVVCGVDYRETLEKRYQGLVESNVEANFYEDVIGGQTVKVLERASLGASAKEIAAITPSGVGYRLNFYCPDEDEALNFSMILDVMEHFTDHIQFK